MPTRDELANALRKADAAGNGVDAKRLADAIRAMDASGGSASPQKYAPIVDANKPAPIEGTYTVKPAQPSQPSNGAGLSSVNPMVEMGLNAQREALIGQRDRGVQAKVDQFTQNERTRSAFVPEPVNRAEIDAELRDRANGRISGLNDKLGGNVQFSDKPAQPFDEMGMPAQAPLDRNVAAIQTDLSKGAQTAIPKAYNGMIRGTESILNLPSDAADFVSGFSRKADGTPLDKVPRFDFSEARVGFEPDQESLSGGLLEGLAQFLVSRKLVGSVAPGGGLLPQLGKDAVATGIGFDGTTGRMADILPVDKLPEGPLRDAAMLLRSQPEDSALVGRFKNLIEDMLFAGPMLAPHAAVRGAEAGIRKIGEAVNPPMAPTNAGGARPGPINTATLQQPPPSAAPPVAPIAQNAPAATQGRSAAAIAAAKQQSETRAQLQAGIDAAKARGDNEVAAQLESQLRDSTFIIDPQTGQRVGRASPPQGAQQPKSMFSSKAEYSVATEDSGTFGVSFNRTKDGGAVIFHDKGTVEYNPEFAKGKSDEELLAYTFEPLGYQGATKGGAQAASAAQPSVAPVGPPPPRQPVPVATQTASAGAPPIQPPPPAVATANAAVPTPGGVPPAGNLVPIPQNEAVAAFNALPPKTREAMLRTLNSAGMDANGFWSDTWRKLTGRFRNSSEAMNAIRQLGNMPEDQQVMFALELMKNHGGDLETILPAMGRKWATEGARDPQLFGGTDRAREIMDAGVPQIINYQGQRVGGLAEKNFGPGIVPAGEAIDVEKKALATQYDKLLNPQRSQYSTGGKGQVKAPQKKAVIDQAIASIKTYLKRPEVIDQMPDWVKMKVMQRASEDMRNIGFTDAQKAIILAGDGAVLAPLFEASGPLSWSPQMWAHLVEQYPTQAAHVLQSAYREAADGLMSGVSRTQADVTNAQYLMRLRGESGKGGLIDMLERAIPGKGGKIDGENGYQWTRKNFGDNRSAERAFDILERFKTAVNKEGDVAAIITELKDLPARHREAAENQITSLIRQELGRKVENVKLSELDNPERLSAPNLTALSSKNFLNALEDVFGARGKELADGIRLARASTDTLTSISPKYNSRTAINDQDVQKAGARYEDPAGSDNGIIDKTVGGLTSSGIATGAAGVLGISSAGSLTAPLLGLAAGKALYNAYKAGKRLSNAERNQLVDFLFRARKAGEGAPVPRGVNHGNVVGTAAVNAAVGGTIGGFSSDGDPSAIAAGAVGGAVLGASRKLIKSQSSLIKPTRPPGPRPRRGPPPSGRVTGAGPAPQITPPAQMGWFGGSKPPKPPKPPRGPVPKAPVAKGADYKLSNLSPGDRIATINSRHQPAGPNLPLPYWDAATAIKRNGGDRAAATAELQRYADYLRKTKTDPVMIENVDRTIKAVDAVDPVDFDDAAFNASMKGKIEADGTAAMEQAGVDVPSSRQAISRTPETLEQIDADHVSELRQILADLEADKSLPSKMKEQLRRDLLVKIEEASPSKPGPKPVKNGIGSLPMDEGARTGGGDWAEVVPTKLDAGSRAVVDDHFGEGFADIIDADQTGQQALYYAKALLQEGETAEQQATVALLEQIGLARQAGRPSSKLLSGMEANGTGVGVATGAVAGGALAPDTNKDGKVDSTERMAGAVGGAISGGVLGYGASKGAGNRLASGRARGRFRAPDQATFGGVNAKTADRAALGRAQNMEAAGADRNAIWDATGWFKGVDGKWRFEIDDSRSTFNEIGNGQDHLTHPDGMFKAYRDVPGMQDLGDVRVMRSGRPDEGAFMGSGTPIESLHIGKGSSDPRSVALHEYQHGIQAREDFARGGSPNNATRALGYLPDQLVVTQSEYLLDMAKKYYNGSVDEAARNLRPLNADEWQTAAIGIARDDPSRIPLLKEKLSLANNPYEAYRRLAGETESRNVEARRDFTPEERRAKRPWETQDVPDDQQIVRFGSGKAESRPKPPPQAYGGSKSGPPANKLSSGPPKPRPVEARRAAPRGNKPFSDPRLSPGENKTSEMILNGHTYEEIADEMMTSIDVVKKQASVAQKKLGTDVQLPRPGMGKRPPGSTKREAAFELFDSGVENAQIAERLGMTIGNVRTYRSYWKEQSRAPVASIEGAAYNPPAMPTRPFEADYPQKDWPDGPPVDAQGRLTRDRDGRPLDQTSVIIGRNKAPGNGPKSEADRSLRDRIAVIQTLKKAGSSIERVPRSSDQASGMWSPNFDANGRFTGRSSTQIVDDLDRPIAGLDDREVITMSHELAHSIDFKANPARNTSDFNSRKWGIDHKNPYMTPEIKAELESQLQRIYRDLNNPIDGEVKIHTPKDRGYGPMDEDRELWAEAIRAYMYDPNYIKTVAPDVAFMIRDHVNRNRSLRKTIQFNAIPTIVGVGGGLGLGAAALSGQPAEAQKR